MANLQGTYRCMVNIYFGGSVLIAQVGDERTFAEWAVLLGPMWSPGANAQSSLAARIDEFNGADAQHPLWFQEVTPGEIAFPVDGEFYVAAPVAGLLNARVGTASATISPDHSVAGQVTFHLNPTGAPVGTFVNATVTTNALGQITGIVAGSGAPGATWGFITGDITDQLDLMAAFAAILHAPTHKIGGTDEILLDELGTPTDNTNLNVSTTAHGLAPKLPGDGSVYLDGFGNYTVPPGGGGGGGGSMNVLVAVDTAGGTALRGPDWVDLPFNTTSLVDSAAFTRTNNIETTVNLSRRYEIEACCRVILDTANTQLRMRIMVDSGAGYVAVTQPEGWSYNDGISPNNQSCYVKAIVALTATDKFKIQVTSNTGTEDNDAEASGSALWAKVLEVATGGSPTYDTTTNPGYLTIPGVGLIPIII
jgi:hypothetical protein